MDAVGDMTDRHFRLGPAGKQALKDTAAYRAMETADAIDYPAAAHGEIRHVEGFVDIVRTLATERQQPRKSIRSRCSA